MVDRYTKAVLTVIAVALVWIAAALTTVPTAEATAPGTQALTRVDIVSVGGRPVSFHRAGKPVTAIPVEVLSQK